MSYSFPLIHKSVKCESNDNFLNYRLREDKSQACEKGKYQGPQSQHLGFKKRNIEYSIHKYAVIPSLSGVIPFLFLPFVGGGVRDFSF